MFHRKLTVPRYSFSVLDQQQKSPSTFWIQVLVQIAAILVGYALIKAYKGFVYKSLRSFFTSESGGKEWILGADEHEPHSMTHSDQLSFGHPLADSMPEFCRGSKLHDFVVPRERPQGKKRSLSNEESLLRWKEWKNMRAGIYWNYGTSLSCYYSNPCLMVGPRHQVKSDKFGRSLRRRWSFGSAEHLLFRRTVNGPLSTAGGTSSEKLLRKFINHSAQRERTWLYCLAQMPKLECKKVTFEADPKPKAAPAAPGVVRKNSLTKRSETTVGSRSSPNSASQQLRGGTSRPNIRKPIAGRNQSPDRSNSTEKTITKASGPASPSRTRASTATNSRPSSGAEEGKKKHAAVPPKKTTTKKRDTTSPPAETLKKNLDKQHKAEPNKTQEEQEKTSKNKHTKKELRLPPIPEETDAQMVEEAAEFKRYLMMKSPGFNDHSLSKPASSNSSLVGSLVKWYASLELVGERENCASWNGQEPGDPPIPSSLMDEKDMEETELEDSPLSRTLTPARL